MMKNFIISNLFISFTDEIKKLLDNSPKLQKYLNLIPCFYWRKRYFKKFKKYNDFKQFLKNKRICLVGPAEYVDKEFTNHGKIIDSYDVVIRVNNFINIDKSLFKNFGTRIDILITSLWFDPRNTYCHEDSYTKEKIPNQLLIYYQNGRLRKLFFSFFLRNDNISICEQPKQNFEDLLKIIPDPTTGMIAIFDCLKCNPKELFITGFTFGQDEKYSSYVDKYYKNYIHDKTIKDKNDFHGAHKVSSEYQFVKKLILTHNNISIDDYLRKTIFNLENKNNKT